MGIATTLYIITTLILFGLNLIANIFAMAFNQKNEFPVSGFIATILAIAFLVWGITLLVIN